MNKWEHRETKLKKRRKQTFNEDKETSPKDKFRRKEIKQARRDKEAMWNNLDSEGDE